MAMSACRECGKEVSSAAKTCPHCGVAAPVKSSAGRKLLYILLAVFALVVLRNLTGVSGGTGSDAAATTATRPSPENDPDFGRFVISQAKSYLQSQLKDPESVRWGRIDARVLDRDGKSAVVACGSYNSKNSMGGYTGSKRFISNGTADMTFSEAAMGTEFPSTWELVCGGRILATAE